MAATKEVAQLLDDGLSHFGVGAIERAVACWERVLTLEPGNEVARDYLEDARASAAEANPQVAGLLADARQLLAADQLEEALDHFQLSARLDPGRVETELYIELLRARLMARYRTRVGHGGARPHLELPPGEVARYNLSADAGFLLSRLDGRTSVDEIVSLSGMDAFDALRNLDRMLDAGIIGVAG